VFFNVDRAILEVELIYLLTFIVYSDGNS